MTLTPINPASAAADRTASELRTAVEDSIKAHAGCGLAGFAVLTWDLNGSVWTSLAAHRGVIGPGMVPALAMSAFTVHRAVQRAAPERLEPLSGA